MRFHTLRVDRVDRETPDAVTVSFEVPAALQDAFRYRPGQYLTLRATIGGEEIRRSYSICSTAGGPLRVGIKRVPGGRFSSWAHRELVAGVTLDVMAPSGRFGCPEAGSTGMHHVAFAAGSGITPILSIVSHVLETRPRDRFTLFYGNRALASVMFLEELHRAKDRWLERFRLFHFLSGESVDVPLLRGRLDRAKVEALMEVGLLSAEDADVVYVCGPGSMIDEVTSALGAAGVPGERIRLERFAEPSGRVARSGSAPAPAPSDEGGVRVEALLDGARRTFTVRPGEGLLDAGARQGIELPYSCAGGMCSTCRCRLVEGSADMRLNYSLEPWELERGYILACQAVPRSPALVLDFDGQ